MKKISLLIAVVLLTGLNSCKKTENETPKTDNGWVKIDGIPLSSFSYNGQWVQYMHYVYLWGNNPLTNEKIAVYIPGEAVGSFTLNPNGSLLFYVEYTDNNGKVFYSQVYKPCEGTAEIEKMDKEKQIISGKFTFKATDRDKTKVISIDGGFTDINYSIGN